MKNTCKDDQIRGKKCEEGNDLDLIYYVQNWVQWSKAKLEVILQLPTTYQTK